MALQNKIFTLCMKGLEIGTGERLSQVAQEYLDPSNAIAVWLGPGHVQEFYRGVPNCMVIDSENAEVKQRLVREFSSDLIRFYYGNEPAQLADVEKLGSACAKENTKLIEGMDALRPSVEAGFHSILKLSLIHI